MDIDVWWICTNNSGTCLIGDVRRGWPLEYLTKKHPLPTKRATFSLVKAKSRNALLCLSLVYTRRYLISVLRYKFLILDTYPDAPYLRQQGYEDTSLFLEAKRGSLATKFGKHWATRSRVRPGKGYFAVLPNVENVSWAHPVHCSVSVEEFFSGVKRRGSESDYSPPSSADVKNEWRYTSTPRTCFLWCIWGYICFF